jgi:hypothetical protein
MMQYPLSLTNTSTSPRSRQLLVVVEGLYDIHVLKSLSALLHARQPQVPDLRCLEQTGHVIFLPTGGGNLQEWSQRLAPLRQPEFHLFDREIPPLTTQRQQRVEAVKRRPECVATLTRMRSLENYLHPKAVYEACRVDLDFDGNTDVPELLARRLRASHSSVAWEDLPWRKRKRLRDRAKHLLNTTAIAHMTPECLRERDPGGEVLGWMLTMAQLLRGVDTPLVSCSIHAGEGAQNAEPPRTGP